ncbi:MAG: glycosyltransferase [Pseudomonadota bacterium]
MTAANPSVLHVLATLERGGTESACLSLAAAFRAASLTNAVAALSRGRGDMEEALAVHAGPPAVLPRRRIARVVSFYRLCRRRQPERVLLHLFTVDHVLLGLAARMAGVRRVVVVDGNPAPRDALRKVALILTATRLAGIHLVCASRWIERSLAALGPLPARTMVVHNGCPVDAIARRAAFARARRRHDQIVITMVARLDPIKDHATLLRAFAALPATLGGRTLVLRLIGEGPLRAAIAKRAASLGIEDRVHLMGSRGDVPEQLGESDVFVFATTGEEGFGIALIEALAAGTPVIATSVPACREVLEGAKEGERFGTLVRPRSAKALARAIFATVRDPPPPVDRQVVRRRYDTAVMAKGYLDALFR